MRQFHWNSGIGTGTPCKLSRSDFSLLYGIRKNLMCQFRVCMLSVFWSFSFATMAQIHSVAKANPAASVSKNISSVQTVPPASARENTK